MSLEFHGIPVNPHIHPGEAVVKELAGRTIYRLDAVLTAPEEIDKIEWIVTFNYWYSLNFDWTDGVKGLTPTGVISYEFSWSSGKPPLYLILHDDNHVPPGCIAVEKIERVA